jgi:hypothetical protein
MSAITCPNCGCAVEIEVQGELALGPIETFSKKKLDKETVESVKSTSIPRIENSFEEAESLINSIIDCVRLLIGDDEFCLNEKLWQFRCNAPIHRDAMRYALFKWNALSGIQKRSIQNPAAWLTTLYKSSLPAFTRQRENDTTIKCRSHAE